MLASRVLSQLAASLVVATAAAAADLPRGEPAALGFSAERLGRLEALLRADIDKKQIPGAVVVIARHGKVAYFEALGERDPTAKAPMTRDAIFRIYSMSKPITSVTAMMLWEEGRITLDQHHQGCRGDRLRHRVDAEDGVLAHFLAARSMSMWPHRPVWTRWPLR